MTRKRTSKLIPAKGRLRDMADRLWSLAVRIQWKGRCAVCGKASTESHHLVPRANYATRYELSNGIALCTYHHVFDARISPHMNAAGWLQWMAENQGDFAMTYLMNPNPEFRGQKNAAFFIEAIESLRRFVPAKDFTAIVGKNFAQYLTDL